MDKRYQVFVSSTYKDLKDERQAVMHSLLEMNCIPAGMELFPAANEDLWTLIAKVIDDCDYYLVVVKERFGSWTPGRECSYTEKEYRHARDRGIPSAAFLFEGPDWAAVEQGGQTADESRRVREFRELLAERSCGHWATPDELARLVATSLPSLIRGHLRLGWVRAGADSADDQEGVAKLHKRIEELEAQLAGAQQGDLPDIADLLQGEDPLPLKFRFVAEDTHFDIHEPSTDQFRPTVNEVFKAIGPRMMALESQQSIYAALNAFTEKENVSRMEQAWPGRKVGSFVVDQGDFDTLLVQLRALRLIRMKALEQGPGETHNCWILTPRGTGVLTSLRAIRRPSAFEDLGDRGTG